MTTQQAKEVDLVDYLFWIGHEPEKILRNSYWHISPLRDEKTPSFKVNRAMNRWYDFAEGKGGNLVDFGTRYHQCSVSDFLHRLESSGAVIYPHEKIFRELSPGKEDSKHISIVSVEDGPAISRR